VKVPLTFGKRREFHVCGPDCAVAAVENKTSEIRKRLFMVGRER
jgi:hypothetical protein